MHTEPVELLASRGVCSPASQPNPMRMIDNAVASFENRLQDRFMRFPFSQKRGDGSCLKKLGQPSEVHGAPPLHFQRRYTFNRMNLNYYANNSSPKCIARLCYAEPCAVASNVLTLSRTLKPQAPTMKHSTVGRTAAWILASVAPSGCDLTIRDSLTGSSHIGNRCLLS